MYGCFKMKKFLSLLLCDGIVLALLFGLWNIFTSETNADSIDTNSTKIFLPVIMYHSILPDTSQSQEFIVTPETIENDLAYLHSNGFKTVLPRDLIAYIENDVPLPEKPVMITLDDGNYNNMVYLTPLLEKYDMTALVNVVGEYTDFFSTNGEEHITKYSYLTWEDIKEMENSGLYEIGNHTYNMHSNTSRKGCQILPYETEEQYATILREDIGGLQAELFEKCGFMPTTFAYPFGYLCEESLPVLRDLGIKVTLTCRERPNYITKDPNCLYGLSRYNRPNNVSTGDFMKSIHNS
jgi:peptidoglycan/xylan/chitin deacetylase (PgdA/CDA1 family)